jgi:hypothetical protein
MKTLLAVLLTAVIPTCAQERVQFKLDTSEAEAVLTILDMRTAGKSPSSADWKRLLESEPFVRLKKREASLHRDLTDEDFKKFVMSDELLKKAPALRRTLEERKKTNLTGVAGRILPYLPATAKIRASVYPVIKPLSNSFVFETDTNSAIFLYLDPDQTQSDFENTVAHESHHIGFSDAMKQYEAKIKSLPPNAEKAAEWMGAFGEGLAVLAAAGSPDLHPMRDFKEADRIRWDQDMKYANQELSELNQFFKDVIDGGFTKPEIADHEAYTFFGYRGPWYTVGYKMGQTVEKRYGRSVLIQCMEDPRLLLAKYNEAAAEANASGKDKLAIWSPELLKSVGVGKD